MQGLHTLWQRSADNQEGYSRREDTEHLRELKEETDVYEWPHAPSFLKGLVGVHLDIGQRASLI